jgi:large subunit ribosomal protein L14
MLQVGSRLKVVDNTGAKMALCLKVKPSYRSKFAFTKNFVIVSIKTLRSKRKDKIKVKKGEIYTALILKMRAKKRLFAGGYISYNEPASIVLLNKQKKILGTRIFGSLSKTFRFTNYLKVLSLCAGLHVE